MAFVFFLQGLELEVGSSITARDEKGSLYLPTGFKAVL
jgi:hypothetical protein